MRAKILLLFLGAQLLLVASATGGGGSATAAREKCREEFHLNAEEVERLNKTGLSETDDENKKCFMKCLLTELKLMNEEGEFVENEKVGAKHKKNFAACSNATGSSLCDKAANFHSCMRKLIDMEGKSSE